MLRVRVLLQQPLEGVVGLGIVVREEIGLAGQEQGVFFQGGVRPAFGRLLELLGAGQQLLATFRAGPCCNAWLYSPLGRGVQFAGLVGVGALADQGLERLVELVGQLVQAAEGRLGIALVLVQRVALRVVRQRGAAGRGHQSGQDDGRRASAKGRRFEVVGPTRQRCEAFGFSADILALADNAGSRRTTPGSRSVVSRDHHRSQVAVHPWRMPQQVRQVMVQ